MQSNSTSLFSPPSWLKWAYWLIIVGLGVSGGILYYLQNFAHGLGGGMAFPKLLWLAYALWFWYFLPLLIGCDSRFGSQVRRVYGIFWVNMAVRAVAELWMMYVSHNWHPYWGISHDVFSFLVIWVLLFQANARMPPTPQSLSLGEKGERGKLDSIASFNFKVMGLMLLVESYFAWYMLNNVRSADGSPVYFVPANGEHLGIMAVTWGAVMILTAQQFFFARKWLYESFES
jgi:hypothetical protein